MTNRPDEHECRCEGQPWCVPHLSRLSDRGDAFLECADHDHVEPRIHDFIPSEPPTTRNPYIDAATGKGGMDHRLGALPPNPRRDLATPIPSEPPTTSEWVTCGLDGCEFAVEYGEGQEMARHKSDEDHEPWHPSEPPTTSAEAPEQPDGTTLALIRRRATRGVTWEPGTVPRNVSEAVADAFHDRRYLLDLLDTALIDREPGAPE